ncbi:MAG: hypothetical protein Q7K57_40190 [Burkholderiaceae bacterium]|nr:hypothetical protein [Burkholderiaceae bacterium]
MEAIHGVFDSVKSYLSERFANPLYGAFVLAWAIVNFRLLLVFGGGGTWQEKISYIDTRLYVHWGDWALYGYVYPICTAIAYLLFSPVVNRAVTVYLRKQDKTTVEELLKIEGETPIPKPEADQLRKGLLTERQSRISEQQESSEKQAELSRQIDILLVENKKLKSEFEKSESVSSGILLPDVATGSTNDESEKSDDVAHYAFKQRDFIGLPQSTILPLVARGLSYLQAMGLYALKDGGRLEASYLKRALALNDNHSVSVLLDQLLGLKLIDGESTRSGVTFYSINSAGRQALEFALKQGFAAKPSKDLA